MKKDELKVFYLLDQHYYLVQDNPILKKVLDTLDSNYQEKDIQDFINKLISWYTVKYSDVFLNSFFNKKIETDSSILDIMNFDTLRKSYTVFEEELFLPSQSDDSKTILQKHMIVMVGWGLIYYKKSNPEFGYYRATQLLNDFNSFYSWNLTPSIYLPVLNKNYSPDNEENIQLIEHYKKKKHHGNSKSSHRRRHLFRK